MVPAAAGAVRVIRFAGEAAFAAAAPRIIPSFYGLAKDEVTQVGSRKRIAAQTVMDRIWIRRDGLKWHKVERFLYKVLLLCCVYLRGLFLYRAMLQSLAFIFALMRTARNRWSVAGTRGPSRLCRFDKREHRSCRLFRLHTIPSFSDLLPRLACRVDVLRLWA